MIVVAVIGLVVVAVVLGFYAQKKRQEALARWAASVGWVYVGRDDSLVHLSERAPFGTGHGRRTGEVMRGSFGGVEAMSFAYTWQTGSGDDEDTHTVHVVALALPAYLPIVEVQPEDLTTRVARAFGGQDLEFESDDFNRAFRVQAGDRRTAYAILHPRLMERLLQTDARGLSWRTDGTWIVSWSPGATDVAVVASRLALLQAIVASVPRHVWQDHGYDPLPPPPAPAPPAPSPLA
jgi:hypothetical protein